MNFVKLFCRNRKGAVVVRNYRPSKQPSGNQMSIRPPGNRVEVRVGSRFESAAIGRKAGDMFLTGGGDPHLGPLGESDR
jgi:hypothetical protein